MADSKVRDRIFDLLVSCQIGTNMHTYAPDIAVVSISNIVSLLGDVTKYQARNALKSLIADGLVAWMPLPEPPEKESKP